MKQDARRDVGRDGMGYWELDSDETLQKTPDAAEDAGRWKGRWTLQRRLQKTLKCWTLDRTLMLDRRLEKMFNIQNPKVSTGRKTLRKTLR